MNFNFATVQAVLRMIPAGVARAREFKEVFDGITSTFGEKDQVKLQASYADLIAENDAGHRRLQDKLSNAAKR
jgi:hypothetical protein